MMNEFEPQYGISSSVSAGAMREIAFPDSREKSKRLTERDEYLAERAADIQTIEFIEVEELLASVHALVERSRSLSHLAVRARLTTQVVDGQPRGTDCVLSGRSLGDIDEASELFRQCDEILRTRELEFPDNECESWMAHLAVSASSWDVDSRGRRVVWLENAFAATAEALQRILRDNGYLGRGRGKATADRDMEAAALERQWMDLCQSSSGRATYADLATQIGTSVDKVRRTLRAYRQRKS